MGQVKSHISGYFNSQSKKDENGHPVENQTSHIRKFYRKEQNLYNINEPLAQKFTLSATSFVSFATPRQPLKRTRKESSVSIPQSILDIFSPAKKVKIDIDEFIDFPFLNHQKTINYYKKSKILVILRGLPGSGKGVIVKHLEKKYSSIKICSADHFFMKDGEYNYNRDLIRNAHLECQLNAIAAVQNQVYLVVIDNTNLKLWEMKFYLKLADEFNYVPVIVEPQTPWSRDVSVLASKNVHELDEEVLQIKFDSFEELEPLYFGWFLNEKDSVSLLEEGQLWIEEAYKIPKFKDDFQYFTETTSAEELIEYYKKPGRGHILHVTAKYIGMSRSKENVKYMESKEVKSSVGKAFDLNIIGFVLTPRTFGARVKLTNEQLPLWAMDDHQEVPEEFWEVERPDDEPSIEVEEEEEEATTDKEEITTDSVDTVDGGVQLTNGNGAFSSDSDENETVKESVTTDPGSDEAQEAPQSDVVENGTQSNGGESPEIALPNNVAGESPSKSKRRESPAQKPKENKSDSPPKRFSPRKGANSPKKQIDIPENNLNIQDSTVKSTFKLLASELSPSSRFTPTSGKGSRAHITLGCAPGVKAVITGFDSMFGISKEKIEDEKTKRDSNEDGECDKSDHLNGDNEPTSTYEVTGGVIRNYGNGVWVFYSEENLVAESIFSMYS